MASAAEQLAANIKLANFSKATELKKRIWFTLGALIIYRIGTYIPLPGIDPKAFESNFLHNQQGVLELFNAFSGGAIQRMAIFALNIMPYISASIIIQLVTPLFKQLETLKKEGESGRKILNQYTRYLTVLLAAGQAYGVAVGLSASGSGYVLDPGPFFILSTVITLVGGTLFVMWIGEQITARGIGNGSSLIIFAGIVSNLPAGITSVLRQSINGDISNTLLFGMFILILAVIAFIVFMERAQRRILITYPKRQVGNRLYDSQTSFLPLKLNTAGVIPPIFASAILLLPATVSGFLMKNGEIGYWAAISTQLSHGRPLYIILYVALIVFFAFYYTAQVFNPVETADNLKKAGGFIPGIRPGEKTATFIDTILTRITAIGALYLAIVCVVPEIILMSAGLQPFFGGTTLMIIVSVTLDTVAQVYAHLQTLQYEGLMKRSGLRGRKK